ncbi:Scr1 family TA system antitoxin-like transcriptional regulator [Streptomyces sp. NPDC018964]|uniref:Scr1 family TA system antitoxin-like transcriptional regulator n=1 Tax=unclassified Streptomyces TaxID=2593676 RepID=UPI0037B0E7F0
MQAGVGDQLRRQQLHLDTHHGGRGFLDAEAQLVKYRAVLDHMTSCALGPAESRDFIHHLVREA